MPRNFKIFFISDLHLSKNVPKVAALFNHFIKDIIQPGDTLFILGDFFEYWLGEDLIDETQLNALLKLKTLHTQGSKFFFIHGNRDFLIREKTLKQFGITLLKDPSQIEIHKKKLLLSHGDSLCTNDIHYQRYKKLVQRPWIQWGFLHLPRKFRSWIAEKIHQQNPHGPFIENPDYTLADATPSAIAESIEHYHPDLFIYGHVHKMETYQHGKTTRMVLGDWYHTGNYIEINSGKVTAKVFSLTDHHPANPDSI